MLAKKLERDHAALTAALDGCVEALDAIHKAMAFHAHWKPTMTAHLAGIARAALEQAKKARMT